ncbi:MAG: hypothetical protein WD648_11330 [Planctomycetaceae bacterium]
MWVKWFPWKTVISRVARARGVVDPVRILSRLESFAQPLEVKEPLELLRAGVVFHARGLLNTAAIQHNLDWIWPYWVERQYDPHDVSFIPRAFSITHVNLTHRNWCAVGIPDFEELPIVDPRGLLTPFWDSWSLDAWIVSEEGPNLFPSKSEHVEQCLDLDRGIAVVTRSRGPGMQLTSRIDVAEDHGTAVCRLGLQACCEQKAWLIVALRPYNPEGVSFIHDVRLEQGDTAWSINDRHIVEFDRPAERFQFSEYRNGDTHARLFVPTTERSIHCEVGLATAAALFAVQADQPRDLLVRIPLEQTRKSTNGRPVRKSWSDALDGHCRLAIPDPMYKMLYEAALRTLTLFSPGEVFAGPYTYKRFWFRDAAFLLHALLCAGLDERVERVLRSFPRRQRRNGFFYSQDGEWDSNGEALWIMARYCELTGRQPDEAWRQALQRGGHWIGRRRVKDSHDVPHAGLLPAGFSAEHLGPNDYYYWDDFWGVAGLRSAATLLERLGDDASAANFRREADHFLDSIDQSLRRVAVGRNQNGMPASPYRRMDSGAIGSLAAGYPLQLFAPDDRRLLDTADYLLRQCFVDGGFFLDIIHSGINPYLTLHVAQVLLRAGDERFQNLVRSVAQFASPTGQWPEAVHPRTRGGCMGDGHHGWAAAEWVLMMRNCFVREEENQLVLASGIDPQWLDQPEPLQFGPAPTPFGPLTVEVRPRGSRVEVQWTAGWRGPVPEIEVRLPGFCCVRPKPHESMVQLERVMV